MYEKFLKIAASRHQQHNFPGLKSYIKLLYLKAILLEGALLAC